MDSAYWDKVAMKLGYFYPPVIFEHYWISHYDLIKKWFSLEKKLVLKTDMFEEAYYDRHFSFEIAKNSRVVGVDISRVVLQKVRKNDKSKKLDLVLCDISNLPFRKNSFDLVFSFSTIDNMPVNSMKKSLDEMKTVLKKSGSIFLTADNRHNILYYMESFFWKILDIYHRSTLFTLKEMAKMAKKSHMNVKQVDAAMFFPPFMDKAIILAKLAAPFSGKYLDRISKIMLDFILHFTSRKVSRVFLGRFLAMKMDKM